MRVCVVLAEGSRSEEGKAWPPVGWADLKGEQEFEERNEEWPGDLG